MNRPQWCCALVRAKRRGKKGRKPGTVYLVGTQIHRFHGTHAYLKKSTHTTVLRPPSTSSGLFLSLKIVFRVRHISTQKAPCLTLGYGAFRGEIRSISGKCLCGGRLDPMRAGFQTGGETTQIALPSGKEGKGNPLKKGSDGFCLTAWWGKVFNSVTKGQTSGG